MRLTGIRMNHDISNSKNALFRLKNRRLPLTRENLNHVLDLHPTHISINRWFAMLCQLKSQIGYKPRPIASQPYWRS